MWKIEKKSLLLLFIDSLRKLYRIEDKFRLHIYQVLFFFEHIHSKYPQVMDIKHIFHHIQKNKFGEHNFKKI
jgi:hypothetical protein